MGNINAIQSAQLSAAVIDKNLGKYVDLINANIKPPVPVTAGDIHIRAMYIISDAINSYGGRFDRADLPDIARLFADSPVLIGHDKSGLPVARNFWAEVVEKGDQLWIKCYFYWLSGADGANRLKLNIDSGIYKECSVSFTYSYPECSACGKDIRFCGHQAGDGTFFYYRGVEKVLETSLVYRGSIPGTSITDKLAQSVIPETNGSIYSLTPAINLTLASSTNNRDSFNIRLNGHSFALIKNNRG